MGITVDFYCGFGIGLEFIGKDEDEDLYESVIVLTIGFARIVFWMNDGDDHS